MMILAQPAMAEQATGPGETDDQFLLQSPFLVHFDRAGVNEENAGDRFAFLEDQLSFLIGQILPMHPRGRDPFGQTPLAEKTAAQVAARGLFLHKCKIGGKNKYVIFNNILFNFLILFH
jgi:hypothetical protein